MSTTNPIVGITYIAEAGALFTISNDAPNFSTVQTKNEINTYKWAMWGTNNYLPIEMAEKISKCGVLAAAIEAKARIAIGKGIKPVKVTGIGEDGEDIYEYINDPEINAWMEENHAFTNSLQFIRNTIGYGWSHGRFILDNEGKKIARYKTDDVVKCRLEKKNTTTGLIDNTYYAADWKNITSAEDKKYVKPFTLLKEDDEYNDLAEKIKQKTKQKEFSIISRNAMHGFEYYPLPLWYSCMDWITMAIEVPAMKAAMMNNQMSIKYMININESYFSNGNEDWAAKTPDQKKEAYEAKCKEISSALVGNKNAYKSISNMMVVNPRTGEAEKSITVEVLDDKVKDGKLLPDSGAANKEVLFALMLNPAIMGANTFGGDYSGGAGSGSDIREAYLVQIMLMEAERHMNTKVFDVVKKINGWVNKYPTLKFKYPNLILTTLDKGGSTAPANV